MSGCVDGRISREPIEFAVEESAIHFCRLSWALASGAPAIKEARTTRVAGPHAEFQTSGEAQESCAAKFAAFRGRWSFFRQG